MATNTILEQALRGKLPEAGDVALDDLRAMLEVLLTRVMEAEVTSRVAAERHERSDERTGYRNGTRDRRFDTRLGTIDLKVPKLRSGGYVPAFLDERSRSERALSAWCSKRSTAASRPGASRRSLRRWVSRASRKSAVSEMCQELDEMAAAFRKRPLTKAYPYLMLDALYEKVRIGKHVVSQAVVVAYGIALTGSVK